MSWLEHPKTQTKVAVVGSRDFPSQYMVERVIYELPKSCIIVSGGARGVDTWAEQVAKYHGRDTEIFYPEWQKYGKSAGYVRNNIIVSSCDILIAFWDGKSRGTKHSINLANYMKKPCIIVRYEK